jgi:uncharacterized protein YbjT (DUF2867 family)
MMSGIPKRIAILGGYGNTGSKVAANLAKEGGFEISLLGRDGLRAETLAAEINNDTGAVIRSSQVDVRHPESLRRALADIDLVLSATCDTEQAPDVARAALDLDWDYTGPHLSSPQGRADPPDPGLPQHQAVWRGRPLSVSNRPSGPGVRRTF